MYRIGIIGDRESVLGFKAVGLEVFACDQADEARKVLRQIGKENFAIIYVTEVLAAQISDEIDKYKDERTPAIIAIPGKEGPSGNGMRNVSKAVERAVGADILFGGGN